MVFALFQYFSPRDIGLDLSFLAFIALAWLSPHFGERIFSIVERFGGHLAARKGLAILSVSVSVILVRLCLLWLISVPVPHSHDEFSYLLGADTFAHGRLTNPPHPMWVFFDTIHVNQQPTYMSKYPPAQSAVLALGQILGSPWIGVLLSMSGMCAAVLWMLQGWFPPRWALLGGVLVVLRIGIFSYWMNSYWGGAVAAMGGALVVGALPRILHSLRWQDAVLMGIGAAILMNSRPAEGFFLCLPVAYAIVARLLGKRGSSRAEATSRVLVPLCLIVGISVAFIGYYDWKGTGNVLLMPYLLNERTYLSTPTLLWQKARPPIHFVNPQFEAFYNDWSRAVWAQGQSNSLTGIVRHISSITMKFVYFFIWPELCLALLALPWVLRDRRVRFLVVQTAICFAGSLSVAWYQPHYSAPLVATVFALLVQAIRHLRRWSYHGRPVGIGFTRVLVLFSVILAPFHPHAATLGRTTPSGIEYRARFETQLDAIPGNHLVIVRYSSNHDPLAEWVYNSANIDKAKVVWAREIPGMALDPILGYFRGRQLWLAEPDASPPRLGPYSEQPLGQSQ